MKQKGILFLVVILTICCFLFINIGYIYADTVPPDSERETVPPGQRTSETTSLPNPLCPDNDPNCVTVPLLIGRIIKAVLGIVGSIALLMFVYGGFLWMTSAGNREKVEKGKETLIWATIGLAVIFAAYAMVSFVLGALTS